MAFNSKIKENHEFWCKDSPLLCRGTNPEVLPTTPVWKTVRRVTDGLTENVTTESSSSVADTRFRQGGMATEAEITGSLEVELSIGLFDDFWSAVAMNNWASVMFLTLAVMCERHLPSSKF